MKRKKSSFNIHECEGARDGLTGNGYLLASRYGMLRNMRERLGNAPLMIVYEENYQTYKKAFLAAYWSIRGH